MTIYDRIEQQLKSRNMSRRKLAMLAGIPPATLNTALARKAGLSPENIVKIAQALDVDANVLLYGRIMADDIQFVKSGGLSDAMQKLHKTADELGSAALLRRYQMLNEAGKQALLRTAEVYTFYPEWRDEAAISAMNERTTPIPSITFSPSAKYTQEEIDDYNEQMNQPADG